MNFYDPLKIASNLMLPPASTVAEVLVGAVVLVAGLRRTGMALFAIAIFQMCLFSFPPVADLLVGPLEREARAESQLAQPCCYSAIILLGGSIYPATPPWTRSAHLLDGADRIIYAAKLFHTGTAPQIIVSGGRIDDSKFGDTEAQAMKDLLVLLGVPAETIVKEDKSRNTLDNIAFVHRLVHEQPVALVTSAYHMPRAMKISKKEGLNASAFPTDWQLPYGARASWDNWIPTVSAMRNSSIALHEYVALALDFRRPPRTM